MATTAPISFDFAGKRVLVTGGSQGIGRATAEAFVRAGASVAICSRTVADVTTTADELNVLGPGSCQGFVGDLSEPTAPERLYRHVSDALGPLDVLVNNAAAQGNYPFPDTLTSEVWSWMVQVNMHAPFELIRLLVIDLRARKAPGSVVNVLTDQIFRHAVGRVAYGSTKMGLAGMTRSMALELATDGIRVNAVAPAFVDVPRIATQFGDLENRLAAAPMGRFMQPAEVASTILFLASDASAALSGVILPVDGAHSIDGSWVRSK